ncbi:hypothetical protein [Brevundimonas sp. TWP2-3-2]|uniref:hypothetical protein n=1 Tax=unclassified Brevundimonas TaxID=2622653 RepID=UPI003CE6E0EC
MDFTATLSLILGSSFFTAVASALLGEPIKQHLERKRIDAEIRKSAAFAALYLANALEAYARDCAEIVVGNQSNLDPYDDQSPHRANLNALPDFPTELNWTALGVHLTDDALSFRTRVALTRLHLSEYWEYAADAIFADVAESAAEIGLEARALAAILRRVHGLKIAQEHKFTWDYAAAMSEHLSRVRTSSNKSED